MQYLVNIPFAILNNISLLGLGWLIYKFIELNFKLSAKVLFIMANFILLIPTTGFLIDIFSTSAPFINTHVQQKLVDWMYLLNADKMLVYVGLLYTLVIFFLLSKLVLQFKGLNGLAKNADFSLSEKYKSIIGDYTNVFPTKFKIGVSKHIASPVVFGFAESIILIPFTLCNQLSNQEIKFILLHELAHIIRRDFILNIFHEIAGLILWFNPFSYLIIKEIQLQRELACDYFVTQQHKNAISYAKLLVGIAEQHISYRNELSLGFFTNENQLVKRIKVITGSTPNYSIYSKLAVVLSFTLLLIVSTQFSLVSTWQNKLVKQNNVESKKMVQSIKLATTPKELPLANLHRQHRSARKRVKIINHSNKPVRNDNLAIEHIDNHNPELSYADILVQTKDWISAHQNPAQFANYNSQTFNRDSINNELANYLLMSSIVKSYQLKKAILEKQLNKASNINEANDYLMNSKEWAEVMLYEKWMQEFLNSRK